MVGHRDLRQLRICYNEAAKDIANRRDQGRRLHKRTRVRFPPPRRDGSKGFVSKGFVSEGIRMALTVYHA